MLGHVRRDLTFAPGDTVRTYTEVYGLAAPGGAATYRASYLLLRTGHPEEDILKEEWPDAVSFEFDRRAATDGTHAVTEVLDIAPRHLSEGTYLLRLEVEDLTTSRSAGRATIAFEVRE